MMKQSGTLAAAWVLLSLTGTGASAQAVCSAPHSSPVLSGGGGIGTIPPGSGWIQISAFRQVSHGFFNSENERQPFLSSGRYRNNSAYVTAAAGLFPGIDIWAQLPLHAVRYADAGGQRSASGGGDPRASLRFSPQLVGMDGVPVALRTGVKVPGREFPVDPALIPLGEGQTDWELSLESGHAFFGGPTYVLGWVGHRWRSRNATIDRKPGNEVFGHAALGTARGVIRGELAMEFLAGGAPEQLGLELVSAKRRLAQFQPTIGIQAGRHAIDVTALIPLAGRNVAHGSAISVAYRLTWGNFGGGPVDLQEIFGEGRGAPD